MSGSDSVSGANYLIERTEISMSAFQEWIAGVLSPQGFVQECYDSGWEFQIRGDLPELIAPSKESRPYKKRLNDREFARKVFDCLKAYGFRRRREWLFPGGSIVAESHKHAALYGADNEHPTRAVSWRFVEDTQWVPIKVM